MPKDEIAPTRIFIGLGSNIEPRLDHLRDAVTELKKVGEIVADSSVYETAPVGSVPQPDFFNAVIELRTELGPMELFAALKTVEKKLGRKERPRWHEREIDLDLLFYGDLVLESSVLTIPHSELHRRAFVLLPLMEIASDFEHPVLQKTVSELFNDIEAAGITKTEFTIAS